MRTNQRDYFRRFGLAATSPEATDPVERLHTPPLQAPAPRAIGSRVLEMILGAAGKAKAKP